MHLENKSQSLLSKIDKWLVFFYVVLVLFGWINIHSVSIEKAHKQLIWIGLGLILILIVFILRPVDYKYSAFVLYFLSLISLIGVLIVGKDINGSRSWYVLGPISFQPVEFAKVFTALVVANIISPPDNSIKESKVILSITLFLAAPIILILLQPDPGSALSFFSFALVFYREGLSMRFLWILIMLVGVFLFSINFSFWFILSGLLCIFLFYILVFPQKKIMSWVVTIFSFMAFCSFAYFSPMLFEKLLKPHHKDRIQIIFQNEFDRKYRDNVGYNLLHSKTAIGSGELWGKGYKKGTITKGKFVPEQHTDYIFSTVGEEWGFVGSALLIIAYSLFIGRIYQLSDRQNDRFSRVFGYSVGTLLLFHFSINLGMVMGLVPTIGIPLPFFSYGGSSLWAFTILVFIFIRLDAAN